MTDPARRDPAPDLETLFHAALEQPPEARAAWVATRCAARPELAPLRDELLSLLEAHAAAPATLEAPAWALGTGFDALLARADAPDLEAARPGTRVGHYEVRRLLGQGGMGAVYLAVQREPLRRLVALKLIKPGMDTREVVRRFASERQALARLSHPCVAAVHDAGVTEEGRPYFVMEYVPGSRITDWCDAQRLGQRERLALVVQVCRAVHHAHLQGIVHRDLKPGNVLVREHEGQPLPKIIDFGVAKAMVGRGGASTLSTRQGQVLGTPGYMSPEQAGAVDARVDARSDVYSLGALLHELLTGVLPHERRRLHGAALATTLREAPPPASARVAALGRRARRLAQRRRLTGRQLVRGLRGDLDAVLARALAPIPDDRYPSVDALRVDLDACLAGRAVSAPRLPRLPGLRRVLRAPGLRAAGFAALALGAGAWWWPLAVDGAEPSRRAPSLADGAAHAALPAHAPLEGLRAPPPAERPAGPPAEPTAASTEFPQEAADTRVVERSVSYAGPRGAESAGAGAGAGAPRSADRATREGHGGALEHAVAADAAPAEPEPLVLPGLVLGGAAHAATAEHAPLPAHDPAPADPGDAADTPVISGSTPGDVAPQHAPKPKPSELAVEKGVDKQQPDETPPEMHGDPPHATKLGRVSTEWIDIQGDGLLDLVRHVRGRPPELHVQVAPGRFEERGRLGNFGAVWVTPGARLLDVDADGAVDLVGLSEERLILWEGLGDGRFVDATVARGLHDVPALTLAVLDVDGDGRPDLHVGQPRGGLLVLRNRGGVFERAVVLEPDPNLAPADPAPASPAPRSRSHDDL